MASRMAIPLASSFRREIPVSACPFASWSLSALKAGWEGIGIFFHGSALAAGLGAVWGLAGAVCWETAGKVERRIGNKAINGRLVEGVFPRFILHLRRSVRMGLRVLPGRRFLGF